MRSPITSSTPVEPTTTIVGVRFTGAAELLFTETVTPLARAHQGDEPVVGGAAVQGSVGGRAFRDRRPHLARHLGELAERPAGEVDEVRPECSQPTATESGVARPTVGPQWHA